MKIQFRREKLRRRVEALRRGLQSRGDVLKRINTEEVVRLRGWSGLFDACGGCAADRHGLLRTES